ncbi:MAG: hypothetical protein HZC42_06870 [Candidatus Eisenbacteria bacterium]|nr:hypothetical protein [Candidatus Eisenbacteria bacterium]
MRRLWKPITREIVVEGQRYFVTLTPGCGTHLGQVLLEIRRPRHRRGWSFVLSDIVRGLAKVEHREGFPQLALFGEALNGSPLQGRS